MDENTNVDVFEETRGYSHPHTTPKWIPMGNRRLEDRWSQVSITPPIMIKVVIVETQKQHIKIGIT